MRKPLRVLFVSQTSLGSSTTNRYLQLAKELVPHGCSVTLFFVGKGKSPEDKRIRYPRRIGKVRIRHTPAIPSALLGKSNPVKALFAGLFLLSTALPLLILQSLRHDIVYLGKPLPLGAFLALLCTGITRKPLVGDFDDWEGIGGFASVKQGNNAFAKTVISFFEELVPGRCALVVVVSRLLYRKMLLMGIPESRILYLPNGADIDSFSPELGGDEIRRELGLDGRTVLAYLGTFKPGGANWDFILDTFAEVCRSDATASLLVIGHGPQLADAQAYAKERGIASRVAFAGKVDHENVPRYLAAADAFILPYSDEFPDTYINVGRSSLKLYEYMAMGKPVVASAIGEIREALRDDAGVLVKVNEAEPFAEAIVNLLADRQRMNQYGQKARQAAVNEYNYAVLAQKLADSLSKIS